MFFYIVCFGKPPPQDKVASSNISWEYKILILNYTLMLQLILQAQLPTLV